MSKFTFFSKRGVAITLWSVVAVVFSMSVMKTLVLHAALHDASYLKAAVSAYQQDAGLQGLRPSSEEDPAFVGGGMLAPHVRAARCAAAAISLDTFKKQWLDARTFGGHTIHSHAAAAVLAIGPEAVAARNGCISAASFDAFMTRVESIRDDDLRIHSLGDVVTRLPFPSRDGFFTMRAVVAQQWGTALSAEELRFLRCSADASCDTHAMLKQLMDKAHG